MSLNGICVLINSQMICTPFLTGEDVYWLVLLEAFFAANLCLVVALVCRNKLKYSLRRGRKWKTQLEYL